MRGAAGEELDARAAALCTFESGGGIAVSVAQIDRAALCICFAQALCHV